MSTIFSTTNRHSFTSFYGGDEKGRCLQITTLSPLRPSDEGEGYLQLTLTEAAEVAYQIMRWVQKETARRRELLSEELEKLKLVDSRIFKEIRSFDDSVLACQINVDFVKLVDATCPKNSL